MNPLIRFCWVVITASICALCCMQLAYVDRLESELADVKRTVAEQQVALDEQEVFNESLMEALNKE